MGYTLSQQNALDFARKVVFERDTQNALTAYNKLDSAFAKTDSRLVDSLMESLDRMMAVA
jgi:hypothetical protein